MFTFSFLEKYQYGDGYGNIKNINISVLSHAKVCWDENETDFFIWRE